MCFEKRTLSVYCLKRVNKKIVNSSPEVLERFVRKLGLQFRSNHPDVIQVYDVFSDSEFVYLVEEFM